MATPRKLGHFPEDDPVSEGEYLRFPTGTTYLVMRAEWSKRNPARQNIVVLRVDASEVEAGSTVHAAYWIQRKRRR